MNFEELYKAANLKETETASAGGASSIEANAPENVLEVVNGQEKIDLKESTKNRIQIRKELNEKLFESIDTHSLKKNIDNILPLKEASWDAAKSWILYEKEEEKKGRNSPRYKLQDWTNGGGGDGTEKGQPSAYEAWRRGIVDKKRTARLQQEYEDETNPFKSPTTTDTSAPTLDNQEDAFLSWWIDKQGGK
jgi:predicted DNA-binding antitoxin AbrB/MazE fold protein